MKKIIFSIPVFILFFIILSPREVSAQSLTLDPTSQGVVSGNNFTVKININTGSTQTSGADAMILFDPSILEIQSITNGGFYSKFSQNQINGVPGKYLISGFETDSTSYKSGSGTMANVTFSSLSNGTSTVTFECTQGSKSDSNIISGATSDDVINCTSLNKGTYTVGPSGATPITEDTSSNPTPSVLPRSGSTEVTVAALGGGLLLLGAGLIFIFML